MRINSKAGVQRAAFDGAGAGEGLAVFFSQNGNSSARYRVLVQAMIGEGVYDMGEFYISPPLATAIPGRLSRMVAGAVCPGATSWAVEVSALPGLEGVPAETADILLASSRCCSAPGLRRVGERYGYHANFGSGTFTVLPGMKVTGISALGLGSSFLQIGGGDTITVATGAGINLAPEAPIAPNTIITFNNVDWVIEYLESA